MNTVSRALLSALLMTGVAGGAIVATPAAAQTIAITGGRVVVGDGSAPIENGTVVLRNGRIVAAGANVAVPADAQRIDAALDRVLKFLDFVEHDQVVEKRLESTGGDAA